MNFKKIFNESFISHTLKIIVTILSIVVGFIIFGNYINDQIDNKINDPNYIKKLSLNIRPFLLFNNKGIIKYDHGAEQYLDSLIVKPFPIPKNAKGVYPQYQIKIQFNQFFSNPPLFEVIAPGFEIIIDTKQTNNYKWTYSVLAMSGLLDDDDLDPVFRLELLK